MRKLIQVRLREHGKVERFDLNQKDIGYGDLCVVESGYGREYGTVVSDVELVEDDKIGEMEPKKLLRKANYRDQEQIEKNRRDAPGARRKCGERVEAHNLSMKIVGCEFSLDRSKVVFYFTSEGRVDFRELVKDLAAVFKARIELRQIGVRDEAKMVGGLGICGRIQCCKLFMRDFESINIRMAKTQRLPLNPGKIFGPCGRLLCCLKHECQVYKELVKNLPKDGSFVATHLGEGKVVDLNIIKQTVTVQIGEDRLVEIPASEIRIVEGKGREKK